MPKNFPGTIVVTSLQHIVAKVCCHRILLSVIKYGVEFLSNICLNFALLVSSGMQVGAGSLISHAQMKPRFCLPYWNSFHLQIKNVQDNLTEYCVSLSLSLSRPLSLIHLPLALRSVIRNHGRLCFCGGCSWQCADLLPPSHCLNPVHRSQKWAPPPSSCENGWVHSQSMECKVSVCHPVVIPSYLKPKIHVLSCQHWPSIPTANGYVQQKQQAMPSRRLEEP